MKNLKILFIADTSSWSHLASNFARANFASVTTIFWDRGNAYPSMVDTWKGDWIFSFKSDLILSPIILTHAEKGAINFHPAPPRYRGIGGYYQALINKNTRYAVTCHHMIDKIDYGKIIAIRSFPIIKNETPLALKTRAGAYCLTLYYEILHKIINNTKLPHPKIKWGKRLYTYKDLNLLLNKPMLGNKHAH